MASEDRIELARGLFALITMELEDVAILAVLGQAPLADHRKLAERIIRTAEKIGALTTAIRVALD